MSPLLYQQLEERDAPTSLSGGESNLPQTPRAHKRPPGGGYAGPPTLLSMGGLCSKPTTRTVFLRNLLDSGDVVLFAGRNPGWLLTKVGTWSGFSNVGFLLRDAPNSNSFTLCYSGAPLDAREAPQDDFGRVRVRPLSSFLDAGQFHSVVVRKLAVPLTEAEEQLVRSFATDCEGQTLPSRVTLLMNPGEGGRGSCFCWRNRVERFICSQLVVGMLEQVGRVVKKNREYVPRCGSAREGMVLGPAVRVHLQDPPRGSIWAASSTKSHQILD